MDNNIEQLKLLYNELYQCTLKMQQLIGDDNYEETGAVFANRNKLAKDIENIKSTLQKPIPGELMQMAHKIINLEQSNIEKLTKKTQAVKDELKKASKTTKFLGAYSNRDNVTGDLLDYTE